MRGISSKTRQKKSLEWLEKLEVRELQKEISRLYQGTKTTRGFSKIISNET